MENPTSVRAAFDLTGRVAIVTGAGSGIGRATAEVLAGAGAFVVCSDIDERSANRAATEINDEARAATTSNTASTLAEARALDVADQQAVNELVDQVRDRHGRLDVMCNIAGMMIDSSILDLVDDELDRIVAVNLKGALHGCQAAGRVMVEQGAGSIVNMASTAVLTPSPGVGPYAITKASVVQLTRTMAVEVGKRGVRVNAVAPGFVPTNMTARYYTRADGTIDEDAKAAVLTPMAKFAPLRRVGQPADIAFCVLYLASDASSFMTGQLLSPNGGVAMH